MNEKEINKFWVRLVIIWVVWLLILGLLGWFLIQELRRPVVSLPEQPLTEINTQRVEELGEELRER